MRSILFLSDSVNRRYLETYSDSGLHLPNLDRLLKRCAVFDNHFVGSAPYHRRPLHLFPCAGGRQYAPACVHNAGNRQTDSLAAMDALPDTVTLRAYNCWTKERYETHAFSFGAK